MRCDQVPRQWKMPGRHYQHSHPAGSGEPIATFPTLDSIPLMTIIDPSISYWPQHDLKQGKRTRETLTASNATWKFVYAHHPYLSNGFRDNTDSYDGSTLMFYRLSGEYYRNWLRDNVCGKVDVFSDHDHDLRLLRSVRECGNQNVSDMPKEASLYLTSMQPFLLATRQP